MERERGEGRKRKRKKKKKEKEKEKEREVINPFIQMISNSGAGWVLGSNLKARLTNRYVNIKYSIIHAIDEH